MNESYDIIVCGTGLKECILSGLFSVGGKKVLHVDRNPYYGGDCASLNLTTLWRKFRNSEPPANYGSNRDWNVDLIPKFVMSSGLLVKILLHTKVTSYLEWKSVDGTYVYQHQPATFYSSERVIHKVPSSDVEIFKSKLMGVLEKNRTRKLYEFVLRFDETNPKTHDGMDPNRVTMKQVFDRFGLQTDTIDFIGHAVALHVDDGYLHMPYAETILKMKLYIASVSRYGKSPFIYPVYGLGGIPEGFSRLSAIYGATYMLNKPVDGFEFGTDGRIIGIQSGEEVARAPIVVCDPSYVEKTLPPKIRKEGRIIRCICILGNPIPNTDNSLSCQIIIPQKQLNRRSDIYIMAVSYAHNIAYAGKYVAIVSATIETDDPENEISPALNLLGPIENKFPIYSDCYAPTDDGTCDGLHVTKSYDATSHFESSTQEVMRMYERIMGCPLKLEPQLNEKN